MTDWNEDTENKLVRLVNEGGRSWAQIAAELPFSTPQSCVNKALQLREKGVELNDPEREAPQGVGGGAGRPRNKRSKVRVGFRLAQDVKLAFEDLCTATGEKPGALLRHALSFTLERDELYDVPIKTYTLDGYSPRIPVEWSVPADLLLEVEDKLDAPRYAAAQQAVEHLLEAYGFTIEKTR